MSEPDPVFTVVREWIAKAENDLKTAVIALRAGAMCPTDTTCFHAQQCVEKYLKAFLACEGIAFPKTHNIRVLMELIPRQSRPSLDRTWQDRLTDYATSARYPGWDDISLGEARKAVAVARRVRREVRGLMPRAATVRKRATPSKTSTRNAR
ncbi:MAG: HEPN domain-containing protein [Candidatus Hydrogenedentes bacterium]|nr:HEPN domain-containing protein [Candidatus Hydrogenedentota bacterium]